MRRASASSAGLPGRARATFSTTVSVSNSEKCWNTMPMPRLRACAGLATATSSPSQNMRPLLGRVTP